MHRFDFDIYFAYGQQIRIEIFADNEPMAYRNLYRLINATAVSEARVAGIEMRK